MVLKGLIDIGLSKLNKASNELLPFPLDGEFEVSFLLRDQIEKRPYLSVPSYQMLVYRPSSLHFPAFPPQDFDRNFSLLTQTHYFTCPIFRP